MSIRDNHLHTHHSYDSDANFTDYLTQLWSFDEVLLSFYITYQKIP